MNTQSSNQRSNGKTKPAEQAGIGISTERVRQITQILNQALADQHVLYLKTRNFHWNLVGKRFHTLHLFLEEQYKELESIIDETAERVRQVGGVPHASMREFLQATSLTEEAGRLIDSDNAIELLLADHEKVTQFLRKAVHEVAEALDDAGTADFLTGVMKSHEKTAWMLRSHLE